MQIGSVAYRGFVFSLKNKDADESEIINLVKRLYNAPEVVSKAERTKVLKQWTDFFFSPDPPYPGMTYIMLARLLHLFYVFTSHRTQSEEVCTQTIEKEIENLAEKK